MLHCLMLTWSDERAGLLRNAAESESWRSTVNRDVQEYLRNLFRLRVPLTLIDLPCLKSNSYVGIQQAASHASELGSSQVIICGNDNHREEEIWARGLGVWAYLPGDRGPAGLEFVFGDARQALAKSAMTYVELEAYH
ncbi:hypothetical protein [Bythopirellula polymerisocia]|nr:hypothetical protein [Bythopirellula polymerisocia]